MSLTAQTIRTILPAFAVCLVIFASADKVAMQAIPKPPEKSAGSTILGVVTYADTGRPLRNAQLLLLANDGGPGTTTGVTDGRGEFVLAGIPAGRFVLVIDAPGILRPQEYRGVQNQLVAQFKLSDKRELFTEVVVNGTDSVSVKVQAVRGGVITGRVVSEDDQPIGDANVKLLRRENGKWLPVDSAASDVPFDPKGLKTDSRGVYRIAGLPSGDYLVRVYEGVIGTDGKPIEDGGYINASLMAAYYPSATSIKDAQTITVVEGSESTGIDIRLPERTPYTLSGKALGPESKPAAYAQIIVERTDELGNVGDLVHTSTTSDTEGSWRLTGVSAGDYVLTIGGSIRVGTQERGGYLTTVPKRIKVRVANGDVIVPDAILSPGSTISGKVTLDGKLPKNPYGLFPAIVAVDSENVGARSGSNPLLPGRRRFASGSEYVKQDGSFQMQAVAPGKYWFELPGRADERTYLKAVTRKGVDLMQSPLKVTADTDIDDVVVALATDFATIEGEIAFAENQPEGQQDGSLKRAARDAIVVLAPATDATRRVGGGELLMVPADAQGKFSFSCAPGEYFVTVFTSVQINALSGPLTDEYFKHDSKRFTRVKVRSAEKLKGLSIPVGVKN
jgi:hypothetical protein